MQKLTKSEIRKLEAKKREWAKGLREWNAKKRKFLKNCKKEMKKAFNWYFFYQPKDDGDRAYHIIMWVTLTFIFLRALEII